MMSLRKHLHILALSLLSFGLGDFIATSIDAGWWPAAEAQEAPAAQEPATAIPFPGTDLLDTTDDLASRMVDGIDAFLLQQWEQATQTRHAQWSGVSSEQQAAWMQARREELRQIVGLRDSIPETPVARYWSEVSAPSVVASSGDGAVTARYVTWNAFDSVTLEGLLLEPTASTIAQSPSAAEGGSAGSSLEVPRQRTVIRGQVIVIGDADQTIESLALGLGAEDATNTPSFAKRLAESGLRVLVIATLDRTLEKFNNRALQTRREYTYRPAFELGRGLIAYEVSGVLAARRWLAQHPAPVSVIGWGEGGFTALLAAALDEEFHSVGVSGYFEPHERRWHEPLERNLFGYARHFGDAELAAMVLPRPILIEAARGPEVELPSQGGAPAVLRSPELSQVEREFAQLESYADRLSPDAMVELFRSEPEGNGQPGSAQWLTAIGKSLSSQFELGAGTVWALSGKLKDSEARQRRLLDEFDRHTQRELTLCADRRREFMADVDTSSLASFEESIEAKRDYFRQRVIGDFGVEREAPRVRSRQAYQGNGWTGYDVEMDVFGSVVATGVLLWPDGIEPGERRPVVVCQHGLEGRPQDVMLGDHDAYHDFAAKLAERGFIVYAPQNLYLFRDRFRTLQRKANPLGCTLFSIMTPQHEQLLDWLGSLDAVDSERIAFYGLSYGGKSAMRLPALIKGYCLSICSADFNEWVWKNASTSSNYSYVWTGEYEIFEYNLGNTFNYAEMASLICPRPFMVERGHFDGVAPDETVAYEFAKVRHLYQAKLGIGDRCELEWFVGPHTIHGVGTFEFLHRHLQWPKQQP